jgi:hypothetical protein
MAAPHVRKKWARDLFHKRGLLLLQELEKDNFFMSAEREMFWAGGDDEEEQVRRRGSCSERR